MLVYWYTDMTETMLISIDPTGDRPIFVQIMDEVRRGIVLGTLKENDPLPSVRQLATQLRVNPNTVQQAYRELEREKVVYVRRGRGTFVAARGSGASDRERWRLALDLARRALREAYRHGLDASELIKAIHELEQEEEGGTP